MPPGWGTDPCRDRTHVSTAAGHGGRAGAGVTRARETMHRAMVNQGTRAPFMRLQLGSRLLCGNAGLPWPGSDFTCHCFIFKCWH